MDPPPSAAPTLTPGPNTKTSARFISIQAGPGPVRAAPLLLQQEHQNLQRHKECVKTGRILLLLQISYGDLLNRVGAAAGIHPQLRT